MHQLLIENSNILEDSIYEEVRTSVELNEFTILTEMSETRNRPVEGSGYNHDGSGYGGIEDTELKNNSENLQSMPREDGVNDDDFINDDEGKPDFLT